MHRTIEVTVPPAYTDELLHELEQLEDVINLSVVRGVSVKPPGDVLTVHALNRGADQVMSLADAAREHGEVSVSTAELTSLVDPKQEHKVANDVDEALWEEAETGLRHQGRTTSNFLTLMGVGGAIAATGFMVEATPQTIAFVSASIIAPGFEPLAKIPVGLALRRWSVVGRGLWSVGVGYLVLIISAALAFLLLRLTGVVVVDEFLGNSQVEELTNPTLREILVSACAAVAGITMVVAYRFSVLAGPLMALVLIPAAAMIGVALASGRPDLMYEGVMRLGLDILLVILAGVLFVLLKQALVHRRAPMV